MEPPLLEPQRNRFFILRHGHSLANQAHIISSNPEIACVQHGLSEKGIEQATKASIDFVQQLQAPPASAIVVSSDFLRTRMTADILLHHLKTSTPPSTSQILVQLDRRLRERSFGDLDGGSDSQYQRCWDYDQKDAHHTEFNVESVNSVIRRATELVRHLDSTHSGKVIVLVAHGDVLQILQTAFASIDGSRHRSLPHLDTAAWRELRLTATKL